MGHGSEVIADDLTSGLFDPDDLSSISPEHADLDQLEQNLQRATAGLHRPTTEASIVTEPEAATALAANDMTTTAAPASVMTGGHAPATADFEPSPEQIIRWLEIPSVRQAIFQLVAEEAMRNQSPLGKAIGLMSRTPGKG